MDGGEGSFPIIAHRLILLSSFLARFTPIKGLFVYSSYHLTKVVGAQAIGKALPDCGVAYRRLRAGVERGCCPVK